MGTYTKTVLTVIAACLVWLCVRGAGPWPETAAAEPKEKVVQADRVVARAFVLVNDKGKVLGEWSLVKGEPKLTLRAVGKKSDATLAILGGFPHLLLTYGRASAKAGWYKGRSSLPEFVLRNASGRVLWYAP